MKHFIFFLFTAFIASATFAQGGDGKPPKIVQVIVTNICAGDKTGSITLIVSGTEPFKYTCDNHTEDSNVFAGLKPGGHTFQVTNKFGAAKGEAAISESQTKLTAICSGTNLQCNGDNSGTVSVKVLEGIEPYKFLWSNGSQDQRIEHLSAGTYSVTVTDSNGHGCTTFCSATITAPPPLKIHATATNATCENNGSVRADTSGGTPPYTYSWNNGSQSSSQTGLAAGVYTVTVTDANGCRDTSSVTVMQQGSSIPKYKVGDSISCGYIFYVDKATDSTHPCSTHYLICAYKDQSNNVTWYNNLHTYTVTNATTDKLFDQGNAIKIDTFSLAANTCSKYTTDSCTGWYLPSKTELGSIYINLAAKNIGGFANEGYWSSVEGSKRHSAWIIDFFNGREIQNDKSNKYHVRAVCEVWLPNN
jgi:hypothetical protein